MVSLTILVSYCTVSSSLPPPPTLETYPHFAVMSRDNIVVTFYCYAEVDIDRVWEIIEENIKISAKESLGYYKLKKHTPWIDEGCSKLLNQKKKKKPNCSGYTIQVK
jgi:hypothetical protein